MGMQDLVPFGKYKGQPLEVIATDRGYCDWLLAQAWFVQRYPQLHTLVINNFGEPSETPEHNALQLRLLDDRFRAQCTERIFQFFHPQRQWQHTVIADTGAMALQTPVFTLEGPPVFEVGGIDVLWEVQAWRILHTTEPPRQTQTLPDTHQSIWECAAWLSMTLECKPCIGDEFPAILRFVKRLTRSDRQGRPYLRTVLAGAVQSQTVSVPAMKQFFATSGVLLLLVEEVEATPLDWYVTAYPAPEGAHRVYMLPRGGESPRCAQCVAVPDQTVPYQVPITPQRLLAVLRAQVERERAVAHTQVRHWSDLHWGLSSITTRAIALESQQFVLEMDAALAQRLVAEPTILPYLEATVQAILGYHVQIEICVIS